jgi:hypothetical protein
MRLADGRADAVLAHSLQGQLHSNRRHALCQPQRFGGMRHLPAEGIQLQPYNLPIPLLNACPTLSAPASL